MYDIKVLYAGSDDESIKIEFKHPKLREKFFSEVNSLTSTAHGVDLSEIMHFRDLAKFSIHKSNGSRSNPKPGWYKSRFNEEVSINLQNQESVEFIAEKLGLLEVSYSLNGVLYIHPTILNEHNTTLENEFVLISVEHDNVVFKFKDDEFAESVFKGLEEIHPRPYGESLYDLFNIERNFYVEVEHSRGERGDPKPGWYRARNGEIAIDLGQGNGFGDIRTSTASKTCKLIESRLNLYEGRKAFVDNGTLYLRQQSFSGDGVLETKLAPFHSLESLSTLDSANRGSNIDYKCSGGSGFMDNTVQILSGISVGNLSDVPTHIKQIISPIDRNCFKKISGADSSLHISNAQLMYFLQKYAEVFGILIEDVYVIIKNGFIIDSDEINVKAEFLDYLGSSGIIDVVNDLTEFEDAPDFSQVINCLSDPENFSLQQIVDHFMDAKRNIDNFNAAHHNDDGYDDIEIDLPSETLIGSMRDQFIEIEDL